MTDQPGRSQLGVALDELEAEAELVGDGAQQRALAGARRALRAARADRRSSAATTSSTSRSRPTTRRKHPLDESGGVSHDHSTVMTSRTSLVDQHAADVLAGVHVVVAVVDPVERVRAW